MISPPTLPRTCGGRRASFRRSISTTRSGRRCSRRSAGCRGIASRARSRRCSPVMRARCSRRCRGRSTSPSSGAAAARSSRSLPEKGGERFRSRAAGRHLAIGALMRARRGSDTLPACPVDVHSRHLRSRGCRGWRDPSRPGRHGWCCSSARTSATSIRRRHSEMLTRIRASLVEGDALLLGTRSGEARARSCCSPTTIRCR